MIHPSETGSGDNNHIRRRFDFKIVFFGLPAGIGIVWLVLFGIRTIIHGPSLGVLVLDIDVWLLPPAVMLILGSLGLWVFFEERARAWSEQAMGDLLYTTPEESRLGVALTVLFTGLFWTMATVTLFSFLIYGFGQKGFMSGIPAISLVFILLYLPFAGPLVFLEERFDIHTNGVTRQTDHLLTSRREGGFLPYARMMAFEISPKGTRCVIYLEPNERAFYKYNRDIPIRHLRHHLRKAGIVEISSICPKCMKNVFNGGIACPECGSERFT
jgi:hypothetical protein